LKAIQYRSYGPPDVLEYVDVPNPSPASDEVLIAIDAISVGPGDCKTRAGELHAFHPITFPKVPGRSGAGHVVELGRNVKGVATGDRVYLSTAHHEVGCCAELITRPLDQIAIIDSRLDTLGAAAIVHPAICAWLALVETAQLSPTMAVLVLGGAGSIGAQAIQLARYIGAEVSAVASSRNLDYVTSLGATHVFAYDRDNSTPAERRYDVVLDLVGGDAHTRSADVVKPGGLLAYLVADPIKEPPARTDIRRQLVKIAYDQTTMAKVLALAADGVLKAQIGRVLPLAACANAHRLIESKQQGRGRVMLRPSRAAAI
jgi:NADPH:quinone reductase-like Zn-dependent oxidoreductase